MKASYPTGQMPSYKLPPYSFISNRPTARQEAYLWLQSCIGLQAFLRAGICW